MSIEILNGKSLSVDKLVNLNRLSFVINRKDDSVIVNCDDNHIGEMVTHLDQHVEEFIKENSEEKNFKIYDEIHCIIINGTQYWLDSLYRVEGLGDVSIFRLSDEQLKTSKSWFDMTLSEILAEYKDGDDEPLDGDSVDHLCKVIKAKINLHEGNMTQEEYNAILG